MRIWRGLATVACAAALSSALAATPPTGACSSAAASVNLVAQNRALDATAKGLDARTCDGVWSSVLGVFSTLRTGLFLIFH